MSSDLCAKTLSFTQGTQRELVAVCSIFWKKISFLVCGAVGRKPRAEKNILWTGLLLATNRWLNTVCLDNLEVIQIKILSMLASRV